MKKHILVISQYFYPENFRINDMCKEWVKRGYEVTVVTGIPNYPQGKFFDGYGLCKKRKEEYEGVHVIRLPILARGKGSVRLALNYFSFVVSGFFWKTFTKVKADKVFIFEVSPMTQALVGVWYAKRRKIPCSIYVTDLWPESVEIVLDLHNKLILNPIGKMVDYIYKNCEKIYTSSQTFTDKIASRNVPREKIEFWPQYAEDFYQKTDKKAREIIQDGELNLLFAGNLGYAQGLNILLEAAKILKDRNEFVRFNLVGNGRYESVLKENIAKENVENYFHFIDRRPPEEIPMYMAASDVALIILSKSEIFAMTIPAKTQSCLACGKPIIVSADGEVQQVIKEASCGFGSDAEDVEGFVNNILKMKRTSTEEREEFARNALKYSNEKFAKKELMDRMEDYFNA